MKKALQILVLFTIAIGAVLFSVWSKNYRDIDRWAYIPYENFWAVDVENDAISNTNNSFRKGQPCVLEFGGKVTIIKVSGTSYTLRYVGPDGKNGTEEACGNGTLYKMIGRPNLEKMTKSYLETLETAREEMSDIVSVLNSTPIGEPFTVKEDAYVIIINLNGIKNRVSYREFDFNETCLIRAGGRLEPLGAVKTRNGLRFLHKYWNPAGNQDIDAQCGNGALLYY